MRKKYGKSLFSLSLDTVNRSVYARSCFHVIVAIHILMKKLTISILYDNWKKEHLLDYVDESLKKDKDIVVAVTR